MNKQTTHRTIVYRILSASLAVIMVLALAACGKKNSSKTSSVSTITIPKTYYDFFGVKASDDAKSIKKMGEDYYTKVSAKKGALIIKATESQKQKLIARYNYNISEEETTYLGSGDGYSVDLSDDFKSAVFYLDPDQMNQDLNDLVNRILQYDAMNLLLNGSGTDWAVAVKIVNASTGKKVNTYNIPADDGTESNS